MFILRRYQKALVYFPGVNLRKCSGFIWVVIGRAFYLETHRSLEKIGSGVSGLRFCAET